MRTAEDDDFIDDSFAPGGPLNNDNHSMGDPDENDENASLYENREKGKCNNLLGYDSDGEPVICGDQCNPAEQMCIFCRTMGHRMTGLL